MKKIIIVLVLFLTGCQKNKDCEIMQQLQTEYNKDIGELYNQYYYNEIDSTQFYYKSICADSIVKLKMKQLDCEASL